MDNFTSRERGEKKNVKQTNLLCSFCSYLCAEGTRECHSVPVTRGHGVHVQGVGHVSEGIQSDHLVLRQGQLLDQAEQHQGGEHDDVWWDESLSPILLWSLTRPANVPTCNVLRVTLSHLISLVTPPTSGKMRIFCDTSPRSKDSFLCPESPDPSVSVSCLALTGLSISPLCQCLSPVFNRRHK